MGNVRKLKVAGRLSGGVTYHNVKRSFQNYHMVETIMNFTFFLKEKKTVTGSFKGKAWQKKVFTKDLLVLDPLQELGRTKRNPTQVAHS